MPILLDYSQIAISNVMQFQAELKGNNPDSIKDMLRHSILTTIKSYKKNHSAKFGNLILACDGRNYWRKDAFPAYKAHRKAGREESGLDWDFIFTCMHEIRNDLVENFPYHVIHQDKAEGDDIIAIMTMYFQANELVESLMDSEPQPVLIVSSDHDFLALQRFPNVKQFSPIQKKWVTGTKKEIKEKRIEHIVYGDKGDGIPNILSADLSIVNGVRQKPIMAERLAEWIAQGFDACRNDEERRCWKRNQQLVDFDYIPEDVKASIIEAYKSQSPKRKPTAIFNYLVKNKCRMLLNDIEGF